MSYIYYIMIHDGRFNQQPVHVSYLIRRKVKKKEDSPNAEEVGRPMGSCTPQNSMSESAVYDDQWKRWKLTYQYEIVHKAADIMCTCQYCGCNMCPMVGGPGRKYQYGANKTIWNNNVSCDQEEPPSCLKH